MSSCALVGFILIMNYKCMVMNYLKLINTQQAKVHTPIKTQRRIYIEPMPQFGLTNYADHNI